MDCRQCNLINLSFLVFALLHYFILPNLFLFILNFQMLANKVTTMFNLFEKQLSPQKYYDFGLRSKFSQRSLQERLFWKSLLDKVTWISSSELPGKFSQRSFEKRILQQSLLDGVTWISSSGLCGKFSQRSLEERLFRKSLLDRITWTSSSGLGKYS